MSTTKQGHMGPGQIEGKNVGLRVDLSQSFISPAVKSEIQVLMHKTSVQITEIHLFSQS